MSAKRFFNGVLAVGSIARGITLNILGAGGFLALKGLIESYYDNTSLHDVFRPIYYTSVGLLGAWQIMEYTVWTKDSFDDALAEHVDESRHQELARVYPIHYLYHQCRRGRLREEANPSYQQDTRANARSEPRIMV